MAVQLRNDLNTCSDAERVLREAPVPVLLVRAGPTTRRAAKKRTMKRR